VGARFDASPELLFRLRQVDESELGARAGADMPLSKKATNSKKILTDGDLSQLFGLDIDTEIDSSLALDASRYPLPIADSLIYATAQRSGAMLWTQDEHFKGLPGVRFFARRTEK
jgi:predicted nucleic acid-binding protein